MSYLLSPNVEDIPEASRRSLEIFLGRELHENQRVFIMLSDPPGVPSEATRHSAALALCAIIERAGRHTNAKVGSEDDIDAAAIEAMDHVRRRAV
jgi:hypothetical protein